MLKGTKQDAILRIVAFHEAFRERPLLNAPITPVLSPLTMMSQSEKPCPTSQRTANSRATDSAQPMSLSLQSQPGRRRQAAQRSPTTIPTPQDEDASTHISGSTAWRSTSEWEPPGVDRIDFHQRAHSNTECRGWRAKSFRNFKMKDESGGRVERPS